MSLKSLTEKTVQEISVVLSERLSGEEISKVSVIVENALTSAVNQSAASCSKAAVVCCGPEADLAHKIAEDVERARYALLANLTSMR